MTVLITHDPQNTIYSAFGTTLEDAKNNANALADRLKSEGNYVRVHPQGDVLRPDLYGWNLTVKKIQYS